MNRKGVVVASVVGILCAAGLLTLIAWPATDSITWQPLTAPAWWQFEWLAGLGILLSALPSLVIFELDAFFATNEHLRNPAVMFLLFTEVAVLCSLTYALVALLDKHGARP